MESLEPTHGSSFVDVASTLCIDIGGTGLKGALVGADGVMVGERARIPVTYPMAPDGEGGLISQLVDLAGQVGAFDRVSVGFPGRVHRGVVVTGAKFTVRDVVLGDVDPELVERWRGFDLTAALSEALSAPVRVANDADVQGLAVVRGDGVEVVITLGTGLGSALFFDGVLLPHLEVAHHPFRHGETYEQQLGEPARLEIGKGGWNTRLALALAEFDGLFAFDHLYLGGGNAKRVDPEVLERYAGRVEVVENTAGIIGGVLLWDMPAHLFGE